MDISLVIVNYNVKFFLENTIKSFQNSAKDFEYEIFVVDNASKDGSKEYITSKFEDINYIYSDENLGFAKANNIALKKAKGRYILILNPDTLLSDDTIKKCIDYLDKTPDTSMISCKIVTPDGKLDSSCHRSFPTVSNSVFHVSGLSKIFKNSPLFSSYNLLYKPEDEEYEVDAISGSFMFFRREVLDKGIFMPEDYFMYGEDLDFCYQIKKAGMKIKYAPVSEIVHYRGKSTRKKELKMQKFFYKSMSIFVNKNYSKKYSFAFKLLLSIGIFFAYLTSLSKIFIKRFLLPIMDVISYIAGLVIATTLYNPIILATGLRGPLDTDKIKVEMYYLASIIYIALIILIFNYFKIYGKFRYSMQKFLVASFVMGSIFVSVTYFTKFIAFSRVVLVMMLIITVAFMGLWRLAIVRRLRLLFERAIVVGIDDTSISFVNDEKKVAKEGIEIVGFVTDDSNFLAKKVGKYPVYLNTENLVEIVKLENVSSVIFSLNSIDISKIMSFSEMLEDNEVTFKILPEKVKFKNNRYVFLEMHESEFN